jgi:hypothetical protein
MSRLTPAEREVLIEKLESINCEMASCRTEMETLNARGSKEGNRHWMLEIKLRALKRTFDELKGPLLDDLENSLMDVNVVSSCWLHTTDGLHRGYSTDSLGRTALMALLTEQRRQGFTVEETKDHQWAITRPGSTMIAWLADADRNVIPLVIPGA